MYSTCVMLIVFGGCKWMRPRATFDLPHLEALLNSLTGIYIALVKRYTTINQGNCHDGGGVSSESAQQLKSIHESLPGSNKVQNES